MILLLLAQPLIAIISFSVFGSLFAFLTIIGKNKLAELGRKELRLNQETNAIATENISAVRQVRTFSIENTISNILNKYMIKLREIGVKYEFLKSLPRAIVEIVIFTLLLGLLSFFYINDKNIIASYIPILSIFVLTSQRLINQFNVFVSTKYSFDFYRPTFELIKSLLEKKDELDNKVFIKRKKYFNN